MKNTEVTGKKTASLAGKWKRKLWKAIEADGSAAVIVLRSNDIDELQSICGSVLTQRPNKAKAKK